MPRKLRIGYPRQYRVAGGVGTFTLTGVSAGLNRGLRVSAAQGTYTRTGYDATLTPGGGSASATPFRVVNGSTGLTRSGTTAYATLAQAVAVAVSGDTIKVAAGTYVISAFGDSDPGMTVTTGINLNTLTIEWETEGVMPVIDLSAYMFRDASQGGGGKAGILAGSDNRTLTVRGLHLIGTQSDPSGSGNNAMYGINTNQGYLPGVGFNGNPPSTLNIDKCKLEHWGDGVKTTIYNYEITVNVTSSVIEDCSANDKTHGIYVSAINALNVLGCTFKTTTTTAQDGHMLKSRARNTLVRGSLFDSAGGCNSLIETPSGGAVTVAGNILVDYGLPDRTDKSGPVRYGYEESALRMVVSPVGGPLVVGNVFLSASGNSGTVTHVLGGDTYVYSLVTPGQYVSTGSITVGGSPRGTITSLLGSIDGSSNDGRTHSLLVAQNTARILKRASWSAFNLVQVSGSMTNDAGTPITVTPTVRNNIIADTNTGAQTVASYPLNSSVSHTLVSILGVYSSAAIAGNPLTNDAAYAWAGELTAATGRTDTYRGGRIVGVPTWASAITTSSWGTVSSSSLALSSDLVSGGDGIASAYSGGFVNTVGIHYGGVFIPGTFFCIYGGGHTIWYDEIYAYGPLENDSPTWKRVNNRASPAVQNVESSGGVPVSVHTYSALPYDSSRNRLYRLGGLFRYSDTNNSTRVWSFDFDTADPRTNVAWTNHQAISADPPDIAVYYAAGDKFFGRPRDFSGRVCMYDPVSNVYSADFASTPATVPTTQSTGAVDQSRGIWALAGNGIVNFYRLNNGIANPFYVPTTTGTAPTGQYMTILHDSVADRFVVWPNGGQTLYTLTPPGSSPYQGGNAWTWATLTPSGGATPPTGNPNGTYGKFAYISVGTVRGYLLMIDGTSLYFYRAS